MCESGKGELLRCNFFNGVGDDEIGTCFFPIFYLYFFGEGILGAEGDGEEYVFTSILWGESSSRGYSKQSF